MGRDKALLPFRGSTFLNHLIALLSSKTDPLIVVLGHNDDPPRPGLGSAIFMHLARPGFEPTQGCVALAPGDLSAVLAACRPGDVIRVSPA